MTRTLGSSAQYDPAAIAAGDYTDRARDVRAEDSFDMNAAHAWLRKRIADLPADPPHLRQYPGGASNLTYELTYPERSLILRRPPIGTKAASAHDMTREFRVQQALRPVFPQVPEVLAHCTDPSVIGSDFYVMEKVPGIVLRGDLPPGFDLSPERARKLSEDLVDTLIALHGVDPTAAGLADLDRGPGYVRRQVEGWSRRYRAARTDDVPDFEAVMSWLDASKPGDVAHTVIHGDFKLENMVLDPDTLEIKAVLDWELATVGDPLMDLGCTTTYWIQADDDAGLQATRRQPTHLPGMLTRAELLRRYIAATGHTLQHWTFYEVFNLFRLAVIAQQIYFRYVNGQTTNPAFANFGLFVTYAEQRCRQLAGLGG